MAGNLWDAREKNVCDNISPDKNNASMIRLHTEMMHYFERHKHGTNGGLIIVGQYDDTSRFVHYPESVL